MNETFLFLLLFGLCILFGAFIGNYFARLKHKAQISKLEERLSQLKDQEEKLNDRLENIINEREELRREKDLYKDDLTKRTSELEHSEKKLLEQEKELKIRFENLANSILDEKSKKFTEQNRDNLNTLLDPLQKKIESFEKRVENSQKDSISMHSALKQKLQDLNDLNQQMSKEAINLTKALKGDSKAQGDWGEIQLEILLEKAGLLKGVHYTTQGGFRDDDGNLKKPDFIINLPDKKHLIVDSKVSLTAYESYFSSQDENEKNEFLKKHILSIKKHIKDLGEKRYSDLYGINAPDYVLMFVPVEAAMLLAFNENNKLYLEAFEKNVVLVSVSTLLATLSTVSSIWKQEDQKKNVIEIARQAGALYDKFVGFVSDLTNVGRKIDDAKKDYLSAMNKLVEGRGNLVRSVEKIKKLGVSTKKTLPESILDRSNENDES